MLTAYLIELSTININTKRGFDRDVISPTQWVFSTDSVVEAELLYNALSKSPEERTLQEKGFIINTIGMYYCDMLTAAIALFKWTAEKGVITALKDLKYSHRNCADYMSKEQIIKAHCRKWAYSQSPTLSSETKLFFDDLYCVVPDQTQPRVTIPRTAERIDGQEFFNHPWQYKYQHCSANNRTVRIK